MQIVILYAQKLCIKLDLRSPPNIRYIHFLKLFIPVSLKLITKFLNLVLTHKIMNLTSNMNQINRTLATISVLVLNVIILRKPGL